MKYKITMISGKEIYWESYDTYAEIDELMTSKGILLIGEARIKTEFIESIEGIE